MWCNMVQCRIQGICIRQSTSFVNLLSLLGSIELGFGRYALSGRNVNIRSIQFCFVDRDTRKAATSWKLLLGMFIPWRWSRCRQRMHNCRTSWAELAPCLLCRNLA